MYITIIILSVLIIIYTWVGQNEVHDKILEEQDYIAVISTLATDNQPENTNVKQNDKKKQKKGGANDDTKNSVQLKKDHIYQYIIDGVKRNTGPIPSYETEKTKIIYVKKDEPGTYKVDKLDYNYESKKNQKTIIIALAA